MAKNTGSGSRTGAVKARTQVKNPVTGDFVKRDDSPDGKGKFIQKDGTEVPKQFNSGVEISDSTAP